MPSRGLSAEEKRVKLLEIFHESKDFYQLKELEKLGPKLKGIVSQSVKDVLQSLVDDGLVQADKIGSSNFFWSFPSQQGANVRARLSKANNITDSINNQLKDTKAVIESEQALRKHSNERKQALELHAKLSDELAAIDKELEGYGDADPAKYEESKRSVVLAKEASLRWTDNYCILMSHFCRERGIESGDIRRHLGIPDDYEDIC
ncbi:hypothetical protein AGABI1DRAFT_71597 [Agaricus bisporus var. burnettii JB137-S8]|uniref:Meiotic nuclear division protein 1 n=1 Tax=Agaricus bisporus var. burnettii (strain JB137-S8 / ATCC MYA-4627 / FGSC 10392) TaxID=597362 RepID=K5XCT3_AGABU|nr:uncharacterized protein AGABI1DRAFT_71597 [Agaricus bisporus var. burnettii JB137-S8]EKM80952.1 hypothetical protein AGABI1DRAFT_71597 [Agaricus bisporus var. burnettii JB137-S8]